MERGKVTLKHVRLNQSGYDVHGCYWGVDLPLYWYEIALHDRAVNGHLRAVSRDNAKAQLRTDFHLLTLAFYR